MLNTRAVKAITVERLRRTGPPVTLGNLTGVWEKIGKLKRPAAPAAHETGQEYGDAGSFVEQPCNSAQL
jgi:hypothetical protein